MIDLSKEEQAEICMWGVQLTAFACRMACSVTSCLPESDCICMTSDNRVWYCKSVVHCVSLDFWIHRKTRSSFRSIHISCLQTKISHILKMSSRRYDALAGSMETFNQNDFPSDIEVITDLNYGGYLECWRNLAPSQGAPSAGLPSETVTTFWIRQKQWVTFILVIILYLAHIGGDIANELPRKKANEKETKEESNEAIPDNGIIAAIWFLLNCFRCDIHTWELQSCWDEGRAAAYPWLIHVTQLEEWIPWN